MKSAEKFPQPTEEPSVARVYLNGPDGEPVVMDQVELDGEEPVVVVHGRVRTTVRHIRLTPRLPDDSGSGGSTP